MSANFSQNMHSATGNKNIKFDIDFKIQSKRVEIVLICCLCWPFFVRTKRENEDHIDQIKGTMILQRTDWNAYFCDASFKKSSSTFRNVSRIWRFSSLSKFVTSPKNATWLRHIYYQFKLLRLIKHNLEKWSNRIIKIGSKSKK